MVSLETAVMVVIYFIVAAVVFGLLFFLLNYVGSQFPGSEPFIKVGKIILMILAVLVCIGILLGFMGHPIFVSRDPVRVGEVNPPHRDPEKNSDNLLRSIPFMN